MTRTAGSVDDFEQDWAEALRSYDSRWFAYPERDRDEQVPLLEWVKAQQVLRLLAEHGVRRGRALEYGCGAAGMSIFLQRHGFETCLADISEAALRVASINHEMHGSGSEPPPAVVGDALSLPYRDDAFDIVMSYGLLEHFDERPLRALLAGVCRTLKPGGLFVADIVPARLNARMVGNVVNFMSAALRDLLRGQAAGIGRLHRAYFGHYHETSFGPAVYQRLLREQGLEQVRVQVCRPFPLLAISGRLEAAYVRLMRTLLPLWVWFDGANSWLSKQWGWMYLASGIRPVVGH